MKRTQTPAEVAELLGVNEETIRRRCGDTDKPCPHTRESNGRILVDAGELLVWGKKNNVNWRPGRPKEKKDGNLDAARLRKESALADKYELMLARERGKLLDAATVEMEWAGIGNVVRNAFQNLGSMLVPLALNRGLPNEQAAAFALEVEEATTGILKGLSGKATE